MLNLTTFDASTPGSYCTVRPLSFRYDYDGFTKQVTRYTYRNGPPFENLYECKLVLSASVFMRAVLFLKELKVPYTHSYTPGEGRHTFTASVDNIGALRWHLLKSNPHALAL